jgi:drug/metabolite transporter (DMT)-like permease
MQSGSDHFSGTWRMALAMGLSGTIGLFVTLSGQAPLTVVFFRCLIGGAGLLAWLSLRRGWKPLDARALAWIAVGALALVFNWVCLFSAYRYSSISVATVMYHTQPFMLLVLAAVVQREKIQRAMLPWLALSFVGVVLSAGLNPRQLDAQALWPGAALACGAALLYAVATLAAQRLRQLPPAQIAGLQMVIGTLVLAPLVLPLDRPFTPQGLGALATLGLVHTAWMYTLMYAAFQKLPSQQVAALSFIYPVVALAVDLAWFDVHLSATQGLGMGLILLAVVANQRQWRIGGRSRAARTAP